MNAKSKLLLLHGYTQSGALLEERMGALAPALAESVDLVFPDAPHLCPVEAVQQLYARRNVPLSAPPYYRWWEAGPEGKIYQGLEATIEALGNLLRQHAPVGVLGFSQGAIAATVAAALSLHGELPLFRFAILVAGGPPRCRALLPYLTAPLEMPSLHIYGDHDPIMRNRSPVLVNHYDAELRAVVKWEGGHSIPKEGPAADAIVEFVESLSPERSRNSL